MILVALVALTGAGSRGSAEARGSADEDQGQGQGGGIDAVVVGDARSPALDALETLPGFDSSERPRGNDPDPMDYDMLVLDADDRSGSFLGQGDLIEEFLAATRWVTVLDVSAKDHEALGRHTGFDVTDDGNDSSELFMFGLARSPRNPVSAW